MKDLMIDIETLGTGKLPVITNIGAVQFDLDTGKVGKTFYHRVRWDTDEDVKDLGFNIDAETVSWWMGQSAAARKELTHKKDRDFIIGVLLDLSHFIESNGIQRVWGNGVMFDNRILREAYSALGLDCPWHFRADMDVRTLVRLGGLVGVGKADVKRKGVHHNALDDAIFQVDYCCHIWKNIKKRKKK